MSVSCAQQTRRKTDRWAGAQSDWQENMSYTTSIFSPRGGGGITRRRATLITFSLYVIVMTNKLRRPAPSPLHRLAIFSRRRLRPLYASLRLRTAAAAVLISLRLRPPEIKHLLTLHTCVYYRLKRGINSNAALRRNERRKWLTVCYA